MLQLTNQGGPGEMCGGGKATLNGVRYDVLQVCDVIPSDQLRASNNTTSQLCFLGRKPYSLWPWKAAAGQGEQNGEPEPVLVLNPFRLDSDGDTELELESSPDCVLLGSRGAKKCRLQRTWTSGRNSTALFNKKQEVDDCGGGGGDEAGAANLVRRRKEPVEAKKAGRLTVSLTQGGTDDGSVWRCLGRLFICQFKWRHSSCKGKSTLHSAKVIQGVSQDQGRTDL